MQTELESIAVFITLSGMITKLSRGEANVAGRLFLAWFANALNAQYLVDMGASSIFRAVKLVVIGYAVGSQQRDDIMSLAVKQA